MSSIVLLYGGYNVNFEIVAEYFQNELGYQQIKLPFIKKEHFENNEVKPEVKQQFGDDTMKIVRKCLKKWKSNKIIYPVYFQEQTDVVKIRAYIHIIEVKQPLMIGYKRHLQQKQQKNPDSYNYYIQSQKIIENTKVESQISLKENQDDFEEFIKLDDTIRFKTDVYKLQTFTRHSINCESQQKIEESLKSDIFFIRLNLNSFRPLMQEYFMSIAYLARLRSNCMKKAVGCVIVKDSRIVSIGYNGTPVGSKNCFEGGCERCNSNVTGGIDLDKCLCLHAEDSAILQVGSSKVKGGTLYTTLFPCTWCSKVILQSQIKHVIYSQDYPCQEGRKLLEQADIILRKLDFYFYDKI